MVHNGEQASQPMEKKMVSPKAGLRSLVRKVIESLAWLEPLVRGLRAGEQARQTDSWFTIEEKLCLLKQEEDRSPKVIKGIVEKLKIMTDFMDYDYETLQELTSRGRYEALSGTRTLFEADGEPTGSYLLLSGTVHLRDGTPPPLAFRVMRDSWVGRAAWPAAPRIKEELTTKASGQLVGLEEILCRARRKYSCTTQGFVELMFIKKDDLLVILSPLLKEWEVIIEFLRKQSLFYSLNLQTMREVVKFGEYIKYEPKSVVKVITDDEGRPTNCFFLIEGCCDVIQRLLFVRNSHCKGDGAFKIYREGEGKKRPENVQTTYVRVSSLKKGAFFGFGERLGKQNILTLTNCRFLTLPSQLIETLKDRLPCYQETLDFLEKVFPSEEEVFRSFVRGRLWKDFKEEVTRDCAKKKLSRLTIHDAPLTLRAAEMGREGGLRPSWRATGDLPEVLEHIRRREAAKERLNLKREYVFGNYHCRGQ